MGNRKFYQISILVATALITIGCSSPKAPAPTASNKPAKVVTAKPQTSSRVKVADLRSAGFGTVALKGKKSYAQNQSIQFIVDTQKKTGYLYIVYVDNKGQTALLYPNEKSPLTELNGRYLFPRDFGGMNIQATKDCKGCKEEKTTVYAILTKKRISDIENITAKDLGASTKSKGLSMHLGQSSKRANINIGKIEFFVK